MGSLITLPGFGNLAGLILLLTNLPRPAILTAIKLTLPAQTRHLFENNRVLSGTDLREQVSEGLFICLREKTFNPTSNLDFNRISGLKNSHLVRYTEKFYE